MNCASESEGFALGYHDAGPTGVDAFSSEFLFMMTAPLAQRMCSLKSSITVYGGEELRELTGVLYGVPEGIVVEEGEEGQRWLAARDRQQGCFGPGFQLSQVVP